jgi:hypothetical protein
LRFDVPPRLSPPDHNRGGVSAAPGVIGTKPIRGLDDPRVLVLVATHGARIHGVWVPQSVRLDVLVVLGQETGVKWARVMRVTLDLFLFLWSPIFVHDVPPLAVRGIPINVSKTV